MRTTKVLGYLPDGTPIWLLLGAEDPEETEEEEETTEEEEEEDNQEEEGEGTERKHPPSGKNPPAKKAAPPAKKTTAANRYIPPSEAEWKRTQAALQKASQSQKAARNAALEKARKEGMDEAAQKARDEAIKERDDYYLPLVLKMHAKDALRDANAKNPNRAVQLLDLSKATLQDDGDVMGLEGEINRLKEEWPELFASPDDGNGSNGTKKAPAKKAAPANKVAAADKKDDGKEEKNSGAARVAQRLLGKAS